MAITEIQKGSSVLRPRARIIKTIGEELISNDIVAILELVKNSYDADASIIEIKFEGRIVEVDVGKIKKRVLIKEESSITITDDGCGMSFDIIKGGWMEPATVLKKNEKYSPSKKRRYTGEKGIGRFASAKLARKLNMVTKTTDDNEIVVDFNWADFTDDEKYLDQIECSWEVRESDKINKNGTFLYLSQLNSDWDEDKIRMLRITLSRLINPVIPIPDFLMELVLPKELDDLSGDIDPPKSLSKPIYSIKGSVNVNGVGNLIYNSINITEPEKIEIDFTKEIRPIRQIKTGPFSFEFFVWDRDNETLKKLVQSVGSTVKDIKKDLDALGGISIYRDNFRVLPYGEPDNDWLRLDLRRVQSPTLRISNNQIIGFISVSLSFNPEYTDQSSRQGLVESTAFTDLQDIIKGILNQIEIRRYSERREDDKDVVKQSLFANFAVSKYLQVITNKHPDDKEVLEAVKNTETSIGEGVKRVQEVISQYRRLSTLGLLIDIILHDGNNFLAMIDSDAAILSKELKKKELNLDEISSNIKNIREHRQRLAELFKRIEPFGGRKRGRPKDIIIEEAIDNVFEIYKNEILNLNIEVSLPQSKNEVRIDEGELQFIFVNLLQNSLYWLETVDYQRKIILEVGRTENELSILFSDNGPGIKEEYQSLIFDPYFSTKPNGIGLGLTHVGELVTEYDGNFFLVDNGPLDGANFKIIFRRRI